jgi:hypothetical protein
MYSAFVQDRIQPAKEEEITIKLTQEMIAQSRVIAKGKRIRDLNRLIEQYGGTPSKWVKKSGPQFEVEGERYEYHWYEHHGIGRFEIKLKKGPIK